MKFKRRSTKGRRGGSKSRLRMRAGKLPAFLPDVYSFMSREDRSRLVLIEPNLIGTTYFEDLEFNNMHIPYNVSELISQNLTRGNIQGLHFNNTTFEELSSRPHPLQMIGGSIAGSNLSHLYYSRPNDPVDLNRGLMYMYPGTAVLLDQITPALRESRLLRLYIQDTPLTGDMVINLLDGVVGSGMQELSLSGARMTSDDRMEVWRHVHEIVETLPLRNLYLGGWGYPLPREDEDWRIISDLVVGNRVRGPMIEIDNWQDYEQPPEDYDWELHEYGPDY